MASKKTWCWLVVVLLSGLGARETRAEGALTFFGGANIGGDLNLLTDGGDLDIAASIENSPLFGLRVGTQGFPLGFEGSLTYSPSALIGGIDDAVDIQTSILFVEANVLLILLPGPVAPFVTGGLGVHYLDFEVADLASTSQSRFGWNVGGGLKVNIERIAIRVDVRDHVTTLGVGDFGFVSDLIGLGSADARVHNVELSLGVGIRF